MDCSKEQSEALESLAGTLCEALSLASPGMGHSTYSPCDYCTNRVMLAFRPAPATVTEAQYMSIGQITDMLANELDETRTPDDARRIKAALAALGGAR